MSRIDNTRPDEFAVVIEFQHAPIQARAVARR
jgi:hypothetical protein